MPTADPASTSKPWFLKSKYRVPATKMARPSGIYGNGSKKAGGAAVSFANDWRSVGWADLWINGSPASSFCSDLPRDWWFARLGGITPNLALRYRVRYHRPANTTVY